MNEEEQRLIRDAAEAVAKGSAFRAGCCAFLLAIYGTYQAFVCGLSLEHKFYTYVPIALGCLGLFGALFYAMFILWGSEEEEPVKGWGISLSKLFGMIPCIAGVYMLGFLGFYGLYTLTTEFTVLTLLRSLFFIVIGYKCDSYLRVATEIEKHFQDSEDL